VKVLVIRHASAVPSGTPGIADDDRPLTPRGRARFTRAARGLARIAHRPDVLLTSPLPRARATAEIAARAFGRIEPTVAPVLAHGGVEEIVAVLARQARDAVVVLVGHEPVLGALVARLVGAGDAGGFPFKKGGAALIDLPDGPRTHGRLVWFLKPRILRALSDD
jgi:phosphohistidine phosphatase